MRQTVVVTVHLKEGVRDPAGEAVLSTLIQMGYPIVDVRVGRQIVLTVDGPDAKAVGEAAAQRLLANPVLERFAVDVEGSASQA